MNRTRLLGALAVGVAFYLAPAAPAADREDQGKQKTAQHFVQMASAGGLAEINLGRLAEKQGGTPGVKQFGRRLVADHGRANQELNQIADRQRLTPAQAMDRKHQQLYDRLAGLSGAEFDRAFLEHEIKDHEQTIKLFENEAKGGTDPALKAYAAKTLPTLKEHLRMARDLSGK